MTPEEAISVSCEHVPLLGSGGQFVAMIDAADYALVAPFKWLAHRTRPKERSGAIYARVGRSPIIYMHRLIMGAVSGQIVDHINRNTLDNRRANLRFASASESSINRRSPPSVSGYRGVHRTRRRAPWAAHINWHGKQLHLGQFLTPDDAARAYDEAAKQLYGSFAQLNFGEP